MSKSERQFPRGMPRAEAERAVCETAIAYMDQLCAFNNFGHPEVRRQLNRLSEAVDALHHARG